MSTDTNPQGKSTSVRKLRPRYRATWWRAYEGLPTCARWRLVARRSRRPFPEVLSVVVYALDVASTAEHRGDIATLDAEQCAVGLDMETADVEAIFRALCDTGWIAGGRIATWDDRQTVVADDPTAAERQQRRRQRDREQAASRDVTVSHGDVTVSHAREEKSREDQSREDQNQNLSCAAHDTNSRYVEEDWPSQRYWAHDDTDDSDDVILAFSEAAAAMVRDRTPENILSFQEARNRRYRGRWPAGQVKSPPLRYYDIRTGEPIAA